MSVISNKNLIFLLIIGAALRFLSIYLYGDTEVDNEWGIMLFNLEQNNILSVRAVDGVPVPNIFMPPLYPIFLYVIKIPFEDINLFLNVVLIIQLILSIITIFFAHKIFLEFFSTKISFLGTIIFSLFPLNVYSVSQISSVTLQMFFLNIFLLSYIKLFKKNELLNILSFSISSAALILLRGEFFVFVFLSIIFLSLRQKSIIKIFLSVLFIVLLISPYLYRNFNTFGVLTITKSSGYNLLKGNHPNTVVEGTGMFGKVDVVIPETKKELDNLKNLGPISQHDLLNDNILLDQAIKFIKEDPLKYTKLYFKKLVSFIFIDLNSTYPNYYSIIHIFPKLLLSIFTIYGLMIVLNFGINIQNYFAFFYLANIGLFSFFFILPRYSLFLLTVQIFLSLFGIEKILKKINNSRNEKFI